MADERDPEAGTQTPPLDDGEKAGTRDGADGGEAGTGDDDKVSISKGELGVWKSKAERVNAIEAENARLKALVETRTTTDDRREPAGDDDEALLREIEVAAEGGDRASKAFMAGLRKQEKLRDETRAELEMVSVPDGRRDAVKELMRKTGMKSPKIALQFLRGTEAEGHEVKIAALEAQISELKKSPPSVDKPVRGDSRQAPSKLVNGKIPMTLAEYREAMEDPARRAETKSARDAGKLAIRG